MPSIVGFFPVVADDRLRTDHDLAELLDHFTFTLGAATDSLEARGFRVQMRHGDTLWLRAPRARWRFVREADSSLVGFYLATPDGRHAVRYGSGVDIDLVAYAAAFLRPVARGAP